MSGTTGPSMRRGREDWFMMKHAHPTCRMCGAPADYHAGYDAEGATTSLGHFCDEHAHDALNQCLCSEAARRPVGRHAYYCPAKVGEAP